MNCALRGLYNIIYRYHKQIASQAATKETRGTWNWRTESNERNTKNAELANWKLTFSKTKKTTKTLFLVVPGFFVFFFGSRFLECENANNIETENFGKLNEKNEFCVGKQRKQGNREAHYFRIGFTFLRVRGVHQVLASEAPVLVWLTPTPQVSQTSLAWAASVKYLPATHSISMHTVSARLRAILWYCTCLRRNRCIQRRY